jgi:hypothetical protein
MRETMAAKGVVTTAPPPTRTDDSEDNDRSLRGVYVFRRL